MRNMDVKPANSSHLILDLPAFKKRFEKGCKENIKVSELTATVEAFAQEDKTFKVKIDANAFIPIDPCYLSQWQRQ